jgi:hypothetical protein
VLGWSMVVPIITIPLAIGASALHTGDVNQQIVRDFAANHRAIDTSQVRRYGSRQRKGVFRFSGREGFNPAALCWEAKPIA